MSVSFTQETIINERIDNEIVMNKRCLTELYVFNPSDEEHVRIMMTFYFVYFALLDIPKITYANLRIGFTFSNLPVKRKGMTQ